MAGVVDQDLRRGPLAPEEAVRSVLPIVRSGRNVLWCAAGGLSGFGGLSLAGHPQWAWSAAVAGVTAAAGAAGRGRRQMERQVLAIGIIGGLSPLLGVRELDAQTVVLSRWTRGRSSVPGRVELRYYPGIETGGSWRKEVIRVLEAKTGYPYVLGRDWPRRRRIRLVLDRSPEATKPQPAAQIRLTKAVTDLMGPTATTGTVTFDEAGQVTGFQVTHQASVKLAARGYRVRVERTLGTMLPGRWRAHWNLEEDSVRFELRPVLPTQLWVPASEVPGAESLANYREVAIPYAVDEDGRVISWRPGVVPHFLFIGPTGAGKTSTSRCVISGVTRSGWAMWIADVKRIEFRDFRDWPNVQVVASSIPQIVAMIHQAWRVMMQRYDLVEAGQARVTDFEPLFVLIDEYTEFLNSLRSWYAGVKVKGDPTVPRTLDEVASILRLGRSGRVHLIETAQRPDIALFGGAAAGEMRDNLGQRMSLGRLSPNGALMMWEDASVGVSIPRGLVGRGTTTGVDGRPVEAQAYRFPDIDAPAGSEESALLEQLRPSRTVHERLLILEPEIQDEEQSPTWHHYAETSWVKASDRPDLDPLTRIDDPVDGRVAGSALGVLGLAVPGPDQPEDGHDLGSLIPLAQRETPAIGNDGADAELGSLYELRPESSDGYGAESTTYAERLSPGDLVCLDDGSWVVVDMEPMEDPIAPGSWVISWRDDTDDAGVLSLSDTDAITVRLPLDEGLDEGASW